MASVLKEILIEADPSDVWAVIGEFASAPLRMAPGFVTATRLDEPTVRVVTFADGTVARERLVALDNEARRLAYSVVGDTLRPTHNNASMQVFAHGAGHSRFVWIHDVQPDDLATSIAAAMDHGLGLFKHTLETGVRSSR
ncbi:SRPBCC family protein [Streptomyces sp. 8K308]|uniref:SRPBCC family protein n=1 Tax=Streptomyces sp. 8K308 TaxID=2530388 RepID=UPI001047544A|nr:SRPBCC family protein [Streptomyces sp. 8K308]TDC25810.1 SRPBCC family protein [Streptomyces sp. 8K308]